MNVVLAFFTLLLCAVVGLICYVCGTSFLGFLEVFGFVIIFVWAVCVLTGVFGMAYILRGAFLAKVRS